ncbi:MAG: sigma-E factor negative regulatory protein [Gammaproteobacteria bacterium]|nr:sigma-E factor negative regulatory protein [Gammaproteobacteria bacterium]
MVTGKTEQISALMDGELYGPEAGHAIDELKRDDGLKTCWGRYHLISDVLRNHAPHHLRHGVAESVMCLMRNELPLRARGWRVIRSPHVLKPLAGFALAASVAVLAILSVPNTLFTPRSTDSSLLAAASSTTRPVASTSTHWEQAQPAIESRLNHYLTSHNEYSTSAGIQGVLPYARIVAYDPDK